MKSSEFCNAGREYTARRSSCQSLAENLAANCGSNHNQDTPLNSLSNRNSMPSCTSNRTLITPVCSSCVVRSKKYQCSPSKSSSPCGKWCKKCHPTELLTSQTLAITADCQVNNLETPPAWMMNIPNTTAPSRITQRMKYFKYPAPPVG